MDPAITTVRQLLQPFESCARVKGGLQPRLKTVITFVKTVTFGIGIVDTCTYPRTDDPHNRKGVAFINYCDGSDPIMKSPQFKTFANTRFRPTMYSPHRAIFDSPPDPATGLEPYMVDEAHRRIARGRNKNSTHVRAAVFHYVVKSLEDFTEKMRRGGGAGVTRPKYYFKLIDSYCKAQCDGAVRTRERFCAGAGLAGAAGGGGG
ncbi:hypothetical protein TSOC_014162, partial [Tetrabaena socialis]